MLCAACNSILDDEGDRLEGYWASDPECCFYQKVDYYLDDFGWVRIPKISDTLNVNDTLVLSIGEYNRSDLKPCPQKGSEALFYIYTVKGDAELFFLDSKLHWFSCTDNLTLYEKQLPYRVGKVKRNNDLLDIAETGDTIIAVYNSYWHNHEVRDTILYLGG